MLTNTQDDAVKVAETLLHAQFFFRLFAFFFLLFYLFLALQLAGVRFKSLLYLYFYLALAWFEGYHSHALVVFAFSI